MRAGGPPGVFAMLEMISSRPMSLAAIIGLPAHVTRAVIGMVHLRALPGSPRWDGDMAAVVRAALDDAQALAEGGVDALVVENHGDVPFTARRVDAATVAGMAVAIGEIRRARVAARRRQRAEERRAVRARGRGRHRGAVRARQRARGRGRRRPGHHPVRGARLAPLPAAARRRDLDPRRRAGQARDAAGPGAASSRRRATATRAGWPTRSWSRAWPPASPRR